MTRPTGRNRKRIAQPIILGEGDPSGLFNKAQVKGPYKLAVLDFETDPFRYGRVPKPFCVEFLSDDICEVFWGDDCAERLADFLEKLPNKYRIYAHNGGKFDAHFLHKYIDNPALIIKNRIVSCMLFHHNLRDSYAILPVPLAASDKIVFDYSWMEREVREKHKSKILEYLHHDCVSLLNMVRTFIERYGPRMTIGGTALRELKKLHPFNSQGSSHDAVFRPYYHGGRVQVFQHGIIEGPIKYVDRNSMYPAEMWGSLHPINGRFDWSTELPKSFEMPFFCTFTGKNRNALPFVAQNGELIFDQEYGTFRACSHEIKAALDRDLIEIDEIHECLISTEAISFKEFVDIYSKEKADAKEAGLTNEYIIAKLIQNSAYGRCGINPENFEDWEIHRDFGEEEILEAEGYSISADFEEIELWSKPSEITEEMFEDVAIAASITSAARANLLINIFDNAVSPLYCDTDSIMCRDFNGETHSSKLGAWDIEGVFDKVAIAGKKMYAGYSQDALDKFSKIDFEKTSVTPCCKKCRLPMSSVREKLDHEKSCKVKLSSKGGSLSLSEIVKICQGETVYYENDAPSFSLKRETQFVARKFKLTA